VRESALPESATRDNAAAQVIANRIRMANLYLHDARTLKGSGSRTSSYCLFMAAELTLLAALTAEELPTGSRQTQHQLGAMIDLLPDENPAKPTFRQVEGLTAYATTFRYTTPSGRIPPEMSDADFIAASRKVETLIAACAKWFRVPNLDLKAQEVAGNIRPIRLPAPNATPGGGSWP
jgi:hypothetical protein